MHLTVKIPFLGFENTVDYPEGKTIADIFCEAQCPKDIDGLGEREIEFRKRWHAFLIGERFHLWDLLEIKTFEVQSSRDPIKPSRIIKMSESWEEFEFECGAVGQILSITIDFGNINLEFYI